MAKYKVSENVLGVLWDGLKLYIAHFKQYSKFMLFPVFGQLFGVVWALGSAYLFTNNLDHLTKDIPMLNSYMAILTCTLLIAAPGLILFMKAFWDFLVAYGALNSMTEGAMATGKIYDFPAHRAVITRRSGSFILLWLLFSLFALASIFPLLWLIGVIFFVYFVLIFQVFTFEEDVTPDGCFKRSLMLVKGNFPKTLAILFVVGVATYHLLPMAVSMVFDVINLNNLFYKLLTGWASMLPVDSVNSALELLNQPLITPLDISKSVVEMGICSIVAMFTLPFRSVVWTLWYKHLSERDGVPSKISKGGRKKLDPEILKRAQKKDD
ncbi:hypothetical protein J6A64_00150 [bacterium]|nr:hypothetical protein [bacterium]